MRVCLLPCSALELECEVIRGSVEAGPWPLVLDSGPAEPQSASLDGWRPGGPAEEEGQKKKKRGNECVNVKCVKQDFTQK